MMAKIISSYGLFIALVTIMFLTMVYVGYEIGRTMPKPVGACVVISSRG